MPGRGKTFDMFQNDQGACKTYATNQVQGQANAANQRAVGAAALTTVLGAGLGAAVGGASGDAGTGAAIGAAAGAGTGAVVGGVSASNDQATIQQQYDNAYAQCMVAKGEQVPGYGPVGVAAGPGPAPADPMVRATQVELIRLGYLHDTADGFIGPKTRTAISGFEQSHGMPVDGSPSSGLLARLQSTPTSAQANAAAAPSGWVAPAGSGSSGGSALPPTATASAPSGWVAPTTAAPAATPAAASTAPSGWVAPTKN
jgi:hypothetical protein